MMVGTAEIAGDGVFEKAAFRGWDADRVLFQYDGGFGEVFWIWLVNLFLSIFTLGIYRFWGVTNYRRYIWSHLLIDREPLVYDGRGGELFRRFSLAFLILLAVGPGVNYTFVFFKLPHLLIYWSYIVSVLWFLLIPFAIYASRRYRVSRTTWRGMRGSVDPDAGKFSVGYVAHSILLALTATLRRPWFDAFVWTYTSRRTYLGDWRMLSRVRGRWVFMRFLSYICLLVFLGGLMLASVPLFIGISSLNAANPREFYPLVSALGILLLIPLGVIMIMTRSLYRARWLNLLARCSRIGGLRFRANIRKRDVIRLDLGNLLVMLVTLGTGRIFVQHRTFAFLARHVRVYGRSRLADLGQTPGRPRPKAEGLAMVLDVAGEAFVG